MANCLGCGAPDTFATSANGNRLLCPPCREADDRELLKPPHERYKPVNPMLKAALIGAAVGYVFRQIEKNLPRPAGSFAEYARREAEVIRLAEENAKRAEELYQARLRYEAMAAEPSTVVRATLLEVE